MASALTSLFSEQTLCKHLPNRCYSVVYIAELGFAASARPAMLTTHLCPCRGLVQCIKQWLQVLVLQSCSNRAPIWTSWCSLRLERSPLQLVQSLLQACILTLLHWYLLRHAACQAASMAVMCRGNHASAEGCGVDYYGWSIFVV